MLAIVPARGGSKGLPGKNTRLLRGKPLIAYAVEEALKSTHVKEVIVSTDSLKISEIAMRFGAKCPFMRPAELANDDSLAIDTYLYTIERMEKELGCQIDDICVLQPTSPLRLAADIDGAISLFKKKSADSVVSFTREAHPISWHKQIDSDQRIHPLIEEKLSNRQDVSETYYPNGSIFVFKKDLLHQRTYYSPRSFAYIMPRVRSVDIDSLDDFRYAEFLMSLREDNTLL
jgi:CMP-N,N'-diacetyllegionaminic acid synthase